MENETQIAIKVLEDIKHVDPSINPSISDVSIRETSTVVRTGHFSVIGLQFWFYSLAGGEAAGFHTSN